MEHGAGGRGEEVRKKQGAGSEKTEVRGQRSEVSKKQGAGSEKTEVRGQRSGRSREQGGNGGLRIAE
jgi:hypothetical protein